jgi:hypothetical protein
VVHKHGGNAGAGQQVVHVVVGARQIVHLGLQLGVDRGQLLVDRLQFFLGGFQLFVGDCSSSLTDCISSLLDLSSSLELSSSSWVLCRYSSLARSSARARSAWLRLACRIRASPALAGSSRRRPCLRSALLIGRGGFLSMTRYRATPVAAGPVVSTGQTLRLTRVKWPLVLTCSPGAHRRRSGCNRFVQAPCSVRGAALRGPF